MTEETEDYKTLADAIIGPNGQVEHVDYAGGLTDEERGIAADLEHDLKGITFKDSPPSGAAWSR